MRLSALFQSLVLLGGVACGGGGTQFEETEDRRAGIDGPTGSETTAPEGPFALAYVDWRPGQPTARPAVALTGLTPETSRVAIATVGGLAGAGQLTVSPDGTKLAFMSFVGPDWSLFVLDLVTAEVIKLVTVDGGTLAGQPSWRSDSKALAYVSASGLPNEWVVGVVDVQVPPASPPEGTPEGTPPLPVTPQIVATLQVPDVSLVDCIGPAWAPTGTRLAFGAFIGTELEGVLSVVDPANADEPVTYNPAGNGLVCQPEWSKDGARLVVTERRGVSAEWQLVTLSSDLATVTPVRTLVAKAWPQTQWSPDGSMLAFVDVDASTKEAVLATLKVSDGAVTPLAGLNAGMAAGQPQWSPDGATIAFVDFGAEALAARIRVIPAQGGDASTVTVLGSGILAGHPVWLPAPVTYSHESLDILKLPPKR